MDSELCNLFDEALMAGSLTDDQLLARTGRPTLAKIIPDANVVKIGGQSFIDRGRSAVFPLIDEVAANLQRHKMIIGTGAGTRARHAYSVGLDLGMPTGVLSVLGTFVSMQNARMIHYLLAKHGVPFIEPAQKGLFTADPKKDRHAKFIPKITVAELEEMDLQDVVVERAVLELLKTAEHRRSIYVINGLEPGNLTRALDGEHVGTIITAD
jgi:uridylate kinase